MVNNNFNLGWSSQSCVSQPWGVGENQLAVREVCRIHSDPTVVLGVGFTRLGNTFVSFLLFWGLGLCSPWRAWAAQVNTSAGSIPNAPCWGKVMGKVVVRELWGAKHVTHHHTAEVWRWHVDSVTQSPLGVCDQVMTLIYHRTSAAFHKFTIIYQPLHLRGSSSFRILSCVLWN